LTIVVVVGIVVYVIGRQLIGEPLRASACSFSLPC
jgi:hypothetical protein